MAKMVSANGTTVEHVRLSSDAIATGGYRSGGAPATEYLLIKNRLGIVVGKVVTVEEVLDLIGADEFRTLSERNPA